MEEYSIDVCDEQTMYQKYVQTLLEEKLYDSRDAYDTCHYMMIPMHYAFQTENAEYIEMFKKNMEEFANMSATDKKGFENVSEVDRIQYMYFVTEYMYLCTEAGIDVDDKLFEYAYEIMETYVYSYKGSWESPADYQNMWELLDGLLDGVGYANGKSYEHVITGNDVKILAILCDLKYVYEKDRPGVTCRQEIFDNAVTYINKIMDSQVTWYEDGTWQFQVGAWKDYPDYQFAGIDNPEDIKEGVDYTLDNCVADSNHFMRYPLYLRSYERVQSKQEKKEEYQTLILGLGKTFTEKVLIDPDEDCSYYRLTNYMDGGNGLYRYGYHEDAVGYAPYQQSSEFLLGWWAICGNEEISQAYEYTAKRFPLDEGGKEVYTDPVTVRAQNPIFLMENYEQFLCYLAGKLEFDNK